MQERADATVRGVLAVIRGPGWKDPGPDALRDILGHEWDLPDLQLFDFEEMQAVVGDLNATYVDLPQFCMTRSSTSGPTDPRLSLGSAFIIAGSKVPGDDVFAAVDFSSGAAVVRVFDWNSPMPDRWRRVMPFDEFASEILRRSGS
jgi:hypothetical protein